AREHDVLSPTRARLRLVQGVKIVAEL
ncbi:MAG: hypothetical protein QOG56_456, partial [Solirubrobacteraceae bacterium]|nr:hypothetical protein [Solirubrobacteraceae bacterium]